MILFKSDELKQLRDFIFNSCGIWFNDSKLTVMANRVRTRMQARNITKPNDYLVLISSPDDRAEIEGLINSITTNETYFFRYEAQFDIFLNVILPEIVKLKISENNRQLRIWSAGCSTGEEPYTIAMCVLEAVSFPKIWDIFLYATDISTDVLYKASDGKYSHSAIEKVPKRFLDKYFMDTNGEYVVNNKIKKMVLFEYSNLLDAIFEKDFDLIFCRNVLIYFNDETKTVILNKFYDSLKDNGYLFLGPSEMIRGLADGYKMMNLRDAIFFKKVAKNI